MILADRILFIVGISLAVICYLIFAGLLMQDKNNGNFWVGVKVGAIVLIVMNSIAFLYMNNYI